MDGLFMPTGLFRKLRKLLLRRDVEVVGQCQLCGGCCRDIHLFHKGRWLKRVRNFKRLCEEQPDFRRFRITGRSDSGRLVFSCTLQEGDLCSDHENRMELCRNYPSKAIYYQGGWLRGDCGYSYRVYRFRDAFKMFRKKYEPFDKILQQETEKLDKEE